MAWKTVEVRRKEVPDQKASMAVPPRSCETMGRATLRDVASRAKTENNGTQADDGAVE